MSNTVKYTICLLCLAALLIVCRAMDYRFQMQAGEFPIESCVQVDLVRGEISYAQDTRCMLVVKSFKAGRQFAMILR
jgi:hypothetical protein